MEARAPRRTFSFREYLDLEEASNTKHEYFEGEIYAMAGGSPEHAALSAAVSAALLTALRGGPFRVYSSDLRVRVSLRVCSAILVTIRHQNRRTTTRSRSLVTDRHQIRRTNPVLALGASRVGAPGR